MADDLDSIVKGAPVAADNLKGSSGPSPIVQSSGKHGDPLHHTPSSPAMVYLNLLILEASLRAQFLELRARKRHHTFFVTLLALWVALFGYKLYFAPREDGRGVGGSIYWALEGAQKVCFMGGIVTAILVWATGIWDRGIRWPRRWFAISNRGLRGFNCKLVVLRRPLWAEALSTIAFFLTYGLFSHTASSSYRHVEPSLLRETERELHLTGDGHPVLVLPHDDEEKGGHEEDLAPGGDYVKLLLLPKPFSATFRENWDLYRTEYWERENERRALLRRKVRQHDREMAKQTYGWFWWLPWKRIPRRKTPLPSPPPAHQPSPHQQQHQQHQHQQQFRSLPHRHGGGGGGGGSERARRYRSSSNLRRPSISYLRSQTPVQEADDGQSSRRPTLTPEKRRKKLSPAKTKRSGTESRSATPETPTPTPSPSKEATPSDDSTGGVRRELRSGGHRHLRVPSESETGSP